MTKNALEIICRPLDRWPRADTTPRKDGPFKASFEQTLRKLKHELRSLDAGMVVVQVDVPESRISVTSGWPRGDARPGHPGVIMAADTKHGALKWSCDACERWAHNVHAIALTLERLRLADLYGVTSRGEQYAGWKMLPGPITAGPGAVPAMNVEQAARWASVQYASRLGPTPDPTVSAALLVRDAAAWQRAYRVLAKAMHPDNPDAVSPAAAAADWAKLQEAASLLNSIHNRKGA